MSKINLLDDHYTFFIGLLYNMWNGKNYSTFREWWTTVFQMNANFFTFSYLWSKAADCENNYLLK